MHMFSLYIILTFLKREIFFKSQLKSSYGDLVFSVYSREVVSRWEISK